MADEIRRHRGTNDENPPVGADPYHEFADFDLPSYVGLPSFQKLDWLDDPALADRQPDVAIVGAPFDDAVSRSSKRTSQASNRNCRVMVTAKSPFGSSTSWALRNSMA